MRGERKVNDDNKRNTELIRETFLYAQRFKGARFVIQIGADLVENQHFSGLVRDIGILHRAGVRVILVPGAGHRIDQLLSERNMPVERVGTMRVSSDEMMPYIKMAAFDVANEVLAQLAGQKIDALIGNWVRARAIGIRDGIDFHRTGQVARINGDLLTKVIDEGHIPVLPCIGWSSTGKPYNLSSIELAARLAESLNAQKLFYLDDDLEFDAEGHKIPSEGILMQQGRITRMSPRGAAEFAGMNDNLDDLEYEILRLGSVAAQNGVGRVHYLNGLVDGALLQEVFTSLGEGTMITAEEFDAIRPMRREDVPEVLRIMEPAIQQKILLQRDEEHLISQIEHYAVYDSDGAVRGCCALLPCGEASAEIAALAVDENFSHLGIGSKLINWWIREAKVRKLSALFLLTTQTSDFFESLGFVRVDAENLPAERYERYDKKRMSRVYRLTL